MTAGYDPLPDVSRRRYVVIDDDHWQRFTAMQVCYRCGKLVTGLAGLADHHDRCPGDDTP